MASPAEQGKGSAQSLIGKTLGGRYTIRATIGSGGMGHVYRATQAPINREVAIKVLRVDLAGQDGVAERFKREARAASLIQHPNAITIFDYSEDDGLLYLVMEFLAGETLRQRLRRDPPMEVSQALDMFEAMAGALGAAHRVGVVHRDLKPDNIFLAKFDAVGEVVKVLDFGLAKLLEKAATGEEQLTDHNLRLGTPRYMAPEQALGIQPIDSRCDVYALGLLLYEMLAQRAPFIGDDGMEVLAQRLRREAPRLSQAAPQKNFSEQMDELVGSMLKKERALRPADANEVLAKLREIRKNNQVHRFVDEPAETLVGAPEQQDPRAGRNTPPPAGRVTGSGGRNPVGMSRPGTDPQAARNSRPADNMISLDQDDDLDKRTVVVDPGMHAAEMAMAAGSPPPYSPASVPQAMAPPMSSPGMGMTPSGSAPGFGRATPMPGASSSPSMPSGSEHPSASGTPSAAMAQPSPQKKRTQLLIGMFVLALLAPLLAIAIKLIVSSGSSDDHSDPVVVPEVVTPAPPKTQQAKPTPPPTTDAVQPPSEPSEKPVKHPPTKKKTPPPKTKPAKSGSF
ncbi:MAG TPA: serine/threonine-protein kinase [Pseudomonadota bacterium]|nr:serine/threonine-protein kinase [Pseudomonadota bacterium]